MFRPFVLDDTGRPFVEFVAPDADAGIIAGQAYVGNGTADAVYLTTDAVAAADGFVGGFRYTTAGALRAYDATAGLPAGTSTNQGIAMTSDGQVCYSTAASGTYFNIAGVAVDSSGRILIDPLTFELLFADLGAGVVDTTEAIGAATPTFTRATVAWTKLSSGLWAEVASGSPRSFYSGSTTAVGSYVGYLAEGARTQLVTPTASIRDMTDAAWVALNITPAKTATGIDGVANSASTLTCDIDGGTILQTLVAAGSSRTYSVWLRRVTGVGTITIQQGATTLDVTASVNSTTYTRVELNANVLNAAFGIIMGTAGDVIEADFNQFEAGAFASTPIPAAGARNADVLSYPSTSINDAAGAIYAEFMEQNAASAVVKIGVSGTANIGMMLTTANTRIRSTDGTNAVDKTGLTDAATAPRKRAIAWGGTEEVATGDGATPASGAFDGSMNSSAIGIGCRSDGNAPGFGAIKQVAIYAARLPNATLQELTSG